jgi:hypothetical protein
LQKANVSKEHSRYFLNPRQHRYTLELVEKAQRQTIHSDITIDKTTEAETK